MENQEVSKAQRQAPLNAEPGCRKKAIGRTTQISRPTSWAMPTDKLGDAASALGCGQTMTNLPVYPSCASGGTGRSATVPDASWLTHLTAQTPVPARGRCGEGRLCCWCPMWLRGVFPASPFEEMRRGRSTPRQVTPNRFDHKRVRVMLMCNASLS